ncbi:MAG TPA: transglutaminase family protein, partial [Planctomycetaceae bacterium]|nr:transglutaminase family protein [Planctomycetaceae bacterium]
RTHMEFADYARISFPPQRDILSAAKDLTQRVFQEFEFDKRATTVTTPVEEVFRHRKGVCQDFAHLQIALLRSLRLPARYVSGYLRTIPPPGKPRLIGSDATHAWLSLYCGADLGWIDLDPTNNLLPSTDHITIAWGRDYSDVPPLRGVYIGGGSHSLSVSVDVKLM